MKLLIFSVFAIIFMDSEVFSQSNPAVDVANKIAQKMKDTLSLSSPQRAAIYNINMALHHAKSSLRSRFVNIDSLRINMQRVENTRDSLYRRVLGDSKFILFIQKKDNLLRID